MTDEGEAGEGDVMLIAEEEPQEAPAEVLAKIERRAQQVDTLLRKQQVAEALKEALTDPPTNTRDTKCKEANTVVVLKAIIAIKDVDPVLSQLTPQESDVLMKYLYKGLATGEKATCDQCLRLHERLIEKAGVGSIIRALGDSKHTV